MWEVIAQHQGLANLKMFQATPKDSENGIIRQKSAEYCHFTQMQHTPSVWDTIVSRSPFYLDLCYSVHWWELWPNITTKNSEKDLMQLLPHDAMHQTMPPVFY